MTLFSLLSSYAVICAILWRLMLMRSAPAKGSRFAWWLFGVVHMLMLLSVAVRAVRLLGGHEALAANTAAFYFLVAIGLFWAMPREVK